MVDSPTSIDVLDANGQRVVWTRPTDRATQATLLAVLGAMLDVAPSSSCIAVTKSDATVLTGVRAIYVGTGGSVVATVGGNDVTFANVPDGTTLLIKATKIKAASSASNIVAMV